MISDITKSVRAAELAEKAVASALRRWFPDEFVEHQHDGKFGTDVSVSFRGLRLCFGVEQIDKFLDRHSQYPYQNYPLNTDKRARKMVGATESVLFVVNGPIGTTPDRYMLIFPSDVPRSPQVGRLSLAKGWRAACPWGYGASSALEYRFMVPRQEVRLFSDPFPFDLEHIVRYKLKWNGPEVVHPERITVQRSYK